MTPWLPPPSSPAPSGSTTASGRVIPAIEWPFFADDIDAILDLKRQRNAVILAHNYQTPEIFNCVADIVGDSLALAARPCRPMRSHRARGRALHGRDGEDAQPGKTVLIPGLARRLLARRIDHRRRTCDCCAQRYPGVPIVTYVNTSAAVKAESDICCTSGNALQIVESLGVDARHHAARRVSRAEHGRADRRSKIITWTGHCEVHERFSAAEVRQLREDHPGVVVLAHPECPPEVVAEADFAGSTAGMANYVGRNKPPRVVLLTECSMSDNVALQHPDVDVRAAVQSLPAHEADHAQEHPPCA